ncbi:Cyclochlorotine biosynthesis protein O [Colletotrichum shisoi]|uniref:Cyclochlorotine biosynthesis protein O n=1 Tax=Colletotrichum shisoi TaxID=2078593 RepID=A0A5Q4BW73_9PEZI|nr:Cyclochlorotine biosynthesis protein O [Colletotrichum shisoi]
MFEQQLGAWVPQACAWKEIVDEFHDVVGDIYAEWSWFWDADLKREVDAASIPELRSGDFSVIYTTYPRAHDLHLPPIHFPEDKLEALNKTPAENYEHVSKDLGGGGVKGFLNVFHQLHCLNFVRQYTYRDAYDYSNVTTFRANKEIVRGHVDHCIETLRHFLMCQSDVTPVVFEKDPSRPSGSKSDFNMRRKCRNFGKIQAWTVANKGV